MLTTARQTGTDGIIVITVIVTVIITVDGFVVKGESAGE